MTNQSTPDAEAFQDPLENYDPPSYDDPLAAALAEEQVTSLRTQPHQTVSADTSVRDTMKLMVGHQIACVLVEQDGRLVGVFGDRDVLDNVALEYEDVIDGPVRDVMTSNPVSVHPSDSAARVISVMAVSGYRHVPVVDTDDGVQGIVSPQRVARFLSSRLQSDS